MSQSLPAHHPELFPQELGAPNRYGEIRIMAQTFHISNPKGTAALILVCEHASKTMPQEYARLGLPKHLLKSHIAWDPGALKVAKIISRLCNAPLPLLAIPACFMIVIVLSTPPMPS